MQYFEQKPTKTQLHLKYQHDNFGHLQNEHAGNLEISASKLIKFKTTTFTVNKIENISGFGGVHETIV